MTTRKQKHARALERREQFLKTAHTGNEEVLQKAMGEAKRTERERKIAKSKRLYANYKNGKSDVN